MDKILHDPKDPKLWELWYIPYYGSCRILSINSMEASLLLQSQSLHCATTTPNPKPRNRPNPRPPKPNIGAQISTNNILVAPYYIDSI